MGGEAIRMVEREMNCERMAELELLGLETLTKSFSFLLPYFSLYEMNNYHLSCKAVRRIKYKSAHEM